MKNNTIKKLTALLLALLLLAGLMPAAGYADELPAAQTEAAAGASQASAAPDADETDEAEDVSAEPEEEPAAETDGGSGQPAAEPQTEERIRVVVVTEIEDLHVTIVPAATESEVQDHLSHLERYQRRRANSRAAARRWRAARSAASVSWTRANTR